MAEFFKLVDTADIINKKLSKIPTDDGTLVDLFNTELVDQAYNAESFKAQSGKAVAEALGELAQQIPNVVVEQTFTADSTNAQSGKAVSYAISSAINSAKEELQGEISGITSRLDNFTTQSFIASTEAPANTAILWIDTSEDGGLKYHNGTDWVTVPVRFS
jgi:hypothetical protein